MLKKIVLVVTAFLLLIVIFEGCQYDKADQQYPFHSCDTTVVRYSVEINSIIAANCSSCHPSVNGIDLYDYATIRGYALDGKYVYGTLLSAVLHEGGAPPMPLGAPQLQSCDIDKMRAWVNRGALDN